jgi:N-hydroxyarylamine O-acetyltransferase
VLRKVEKSMDKDAYLERINYHGPIRPDLKTLCGLHRAHLQAVPFENLDISLGRPIELDEQLLFEKIVRRQRGGFCYELNGLFANLLKALGFDVTLLSCRVSDGNGGFGIEFDHMALLVQLEEAWLADVGFGDSFMEPLRLNERQEQRQFSGRFRIVNGGWDILLSKYWEGLWRPEYIFTLQPRTLQDFAYACRYHQTSPDSGFTRRRVISRATSEGRITISDMKLIITSNGSRKERMLVSEVEYQRLLKDYFGVVLREKVNGGKRKTGEIIRPAA